MMGALEHLTVEQLLSHVGVFFGTAVGALLWYRKNYHKPPVDPRRVAEDLVLTSGVIGDMGPVRDAAASLRKIAVQMKEGVEESRKLRHVLEQMHGRLERNAELQVYLENLRSGCRERGRVTRSR